MMQHHNFIESAFENEDLDSLRELADSDAFKTVFGQMGFDEAFDRCETVFELT